jgi:hypothetical protein
MESTHERQEGPVFFVVAYQAGQTGTHFVGGLIGKCYSQYLLGRGQSRTDYISYAMRQSLGLAAACSGQYEKGSLSSFNSSFLFRVQAG